MRYGEHRRVTCVSRLFEANYFLPRDLWKHPDHQRIPNTEPQILD